MGNYDFILSKLFTQSVFGDLIKGYKNDAYSSIVELYLQHPSEKSNMEVISGLYRYLSKYYRNEYFYLNTLFNKLLLGRHSLNTTSAFTQVPIGESKADFVLINGKAVVYEIKSELDTFNRLHTQLKDYFKAFSSVCVVVSSKSYEKLCSLFPDSEIGICVLSDQNTISKKQGREPKDTHAYLEHSAIFRTLHKREYETIVNDYFGSLPDVKPVFYFTACYEQFEKIPVHRAYEMALSIMKKRPKVIPDLFNQVPFELKTLVYFSSYTKKDYALLDSFLNNKFGEEPCISPI